MMSLELLSSLFFIGVCLFVAYRAAIKPQREEDRRRLQQQAEREYLRYWQERRRKSRTFQNKT
jgi:protein-S-isoprenylcysteine O-methyltransferase Ste14